MLEALISVASRDDLIDVFGGKAPHDLMRLSFPVSNVPWRSSESRQAIIGYWMSEVSEHQMPDFIVVGDGEEREFYAWVNTYCQSVAPLSQWCRVYSETTFKRIKDAVNPPRLGSLSAPWAGAIVGECIAELGGRTPYGEISLSATATTYTFPIARCEALWGGQISRDTIVERLSLGARLLKTSKRRLSPEVLEPVWNVLSCLDDQTGNSAKLDATSELIRTACKGIQTTGKLTDRVVNQIGFDLDAAGYLKKLDEMTAEDRVALFDTITRDFDKKSRHTKYSSMIFEFVIAYLANRIGGGGTNHIELLYPFITQYPLAVVWYGICSALWRPELWGRQFDGLGRLVQRELKYPLNFTENPRADMSTEELVSAIDPEGGGFTFKLRGAALRTITVELAPGVVAWFSLPAQRDTANFGSTAQFTDKQLAEILRTLELTIGGLSSLRKMFRDMTVNQPRQLQEKDSEYRPKTSKRRKTKKQNEKPTDDPTLL